MNVVLISPGFPAEMPLFTRALARLGVRVLGVADQPAGALEPPVREALSDYLQVPELWDEARTVERVRQWLGGRRVGRVECLWEPGMVLAARLREALDVPGLTVERTLPFRDKERMKQVLDAAGIRTPHHYRATSAAEVRAAAERVGYPLIVKPIAGAGSADTWRVADAAELDDVIARLGHVSEVSVEEFITGEELTYDTVCAGGDVLYENVAWYRPSPLLQKQLAWVSPQAICLRDLEAPAVVAGRELGRRVLKALGFETGFTHMEWFQKEDGEVVFGEIGARPPGARLVHAMNYVSDCDLFVGWAEAVCQGRLSQETRRKYNAALVFKRAEGHGRIQRIEGLEALLGRFGEHFAALELAKPGTPKVDHKQVVVGDGWLVVRHFDLDTTVEMADAVSRDLRLVAG